MFSSIAHRYDLTNDVLSFGIHRHWRRLVIAFGQIRPGQRVLDVCTGTGDLAICLASAVGSAGSVNAVDFSQEMINEANVKKTRLLDSKISAERKQAIEKIEFQTADALSLPFADAAFDTVTIAFGIRNLDDPVAGLKECKRVLTDGGRVVVLEFGQPNIPLFSTAFRLYSSILMPRIGQLITGNREAYEYLPRTSREFPARERFLELLRDAGFVNPQYRSLSGGIAYLYSGNAPHPQ